MIGNYDPVAIRIRLDYADFSHNFSHGGTWHTTVEETARAFDRYMTAVCRALIHYYPRSAVISVDEAVNNDRMGYTTLGERENGAYVQVKPHPALGEAGEVEVRRIHRPRVYALIFEVSERRFLWERDPLPEYTPATNFSGAVRKRVGLPCAEFR